MNHKMTRLFFYRLEGLYSVLGGLYSVLEA
jgi:hypothetical protein